MTDYEPGLIPGPKRETSLKLRRNYVNFLYTEKKRGKTGIAALFLLLSGKERVDAKAILL